MPDHFHLLITPRESLERSMQFIKGGFSRRAKVELQTRVEIWQRGFSDHRVREAADYRNHVEYIHQNALAAKLCVRPEEYPYSSANGRFELDACPRGLKPGSLISSTGTAEAVPLQNNSASALRKYTIKKKVAGGIP